MHCSVPSEGRAKAVCSSAEPWLCVQGEKDGSPCPKYFDNYFCVTAWSLAVLCATGSCMEGRAQSKAWGLSPSGTQQSVSLRKIPTCLVIFLNFFFPLEQRSFFEARMGEMYFFPSLRYCCL